MPRTDYLTVSETAKYVGVHEGHVRKACMARRLPGANKRGKTWRIPWESAAIWQLFPRPVGRPPKLALVIPPDVSRTDLMAFYAKAETYEEWWAIIQEKAPKLARQLQRGKYPVKTEAELRRDSFIGVPLEVADRVKFPDPHRHKHKSAFPNPLHGHIGDPPEGSKDRLPSGLAREAVKALPRDIRDARREYFDWLILPLTWTDKTERDNQRRGLLL